MTEIENSVLFIDILVFMKRRANAIKVNTIKSVYGKTSLKEYLLKNAGKQQLYIVDKKKAEIISRVIELQLPEALIDFSYEKNILSHSEIVKDE